MVIILCQIATIFMLKVCEDTLIEFDIMLGCKSEGTGFESQLNLILIIAPLHIYYSKLLKTWIEKFSL